LLKYPPTPNRFDFLACSMREEGAHPLGDRNICASNCSSVRGYQRSGAAALISLDDGLPVISNNNVSTFTTEARASFNSAVIHSLLAPCKFPDGQ
jgi:hypothetical protein